jgi:phosphatidylethanolamine/phosphatidyl-N-methylethanolamine N-methyltransferase
MKAIKRVKSLAGYMNIALRDFSHVASLFPSSLCSARAVAKHVEPDFQTVIEYGPGTGVVTKEILRRLSPQSRLIGVEVNQDCLTKLREIPDRRLHLIEGDVRDIVPQISGLAPGGVDAVVTGIPFSLMKPADREFIIENTRERMRKGGKLIAYQNSRAALNVLKSYFHDVDVFFEPRNFLPYFITVATR